MCDCDDFRTTVAVHTGEIAGRPQGLPRTSVFPGQSARNPCLYRPASRIVSRTVACKRGWESAMLSNLKSFYLVSFQNRKTQRVRCHFWAIFSLMGLYNRDDHIPYSSYSCHTTIWNTRVYAYQLIDRRSLHSFLLRTYSLSLQLIGLVLVEASLTSKRPIARLARDSNVCTYARWDGHAFGAFLSTPVCHARSTALVTSLADIPLRHSTSQVCNDVIMAIIFSVQQIDPLFGCNLFFENYIVTIKTSIDNYFVLCILILESLDLGDTSTLL